MKLLFLFKTVLVFCASLKLFPFCYAATQEESPFNLKTKAFCYREDDSNKTVTIIPIGEITVCIVYPNQLLWNGQTFSLGSRYQQDGRIFQTATYLVSDEELSRIQTLCASQVPPATHYQVRAGVPTGYYAAQGWPVSYFRAP
ncbi:MAG: hypothetical protein K2X39_01985, partial [Silvanigrellaceae bacterium]|nr:hypothetical protein [Silvanigrellaceae bacterium]